MKCKNCGTEYDSGICPKCGTYNDPLKTPRQKKHPALIAFCVVAVIVAAAAIYSTFSDFSAAGGLKTSLLSNDSPMSESEIERFYSAPQEFEGRGITIGGMVAVGVQYEGETPYIQIYTDPESYGDMVMVVCEDASTPHEVGDYVMVSGNVGEVMQGYNAFGAVISMPSIYADSIKKSSYIDVVSPTIQEVGGYARTPATQYGYSVAIDKIQFAENETRIYMIVENHGAGNLTLWDSSARLIQNGKQYEPQMNYVADYPSIQDNIAVGVRTEGIITFPAIEPEEFQLIIEAYSDNWADDLLPFSFNVSLMVPEEQN